MSNYNARKRAQHWKREYEKVLAWAKDEREEHWREMKRHVHDTGLRFRLEHHHIMQQMEELTKHIATMKRLECPTVFVVDRKLA